MGDTFCVNQDHFSSPWVAAAASAPPARRKRTEAPQLNPAICSQLRRQLIEKHRDNVLNVPVGQTRVLFGQFLYKFRPDHRYPLGVVFNKACHSPRKEATTEPEAIQGIGTSDGYNPINGNFVQFSAGCKEIRQTCSRFEGVFLKLQKQCCFFNYLYRWVPSPIGAQ
jgi:hypothetical protein